MSFLAPYMLFGALAASIPVILHFFYRSRYRTVPWAAMKFLLAAIEQTSRRLKFQELLLLLLRVLVLLVLAVALARPSFQAGSGRGDAVDAVLILDTSLSMQARAGVPPLAADVYAAALKGFVAADGSVTSFDRARAAALAVVANLPPNSTVQVVSCSDAAAVLGPRNPGHVEQAKTIIEELTPTERGTDLLPAVIEAGRVLQQGPSPNKELYLFSDMQRAGFEARGGDLKLRLDELRKKATVHLVHCPPRARGNVSLAGITPQTTLRSGERADFAVLVRNGGKEPVKDLTVTLEIDGNEEKREAQALPLVGPGETRAVVLGGQIDKPGRHVLTARVRPDDIDGDNRLDHVVFVNDQVGILVVDGAPDERDPRKSASYYLTHALTPTSPDTPGLPVTVVPAERASPRDLGGKELCVLVNVPLTTEGAEGKAGLPVEFTRALGPFVAEGKGLFVVAGDRVQPKLYNDVLFEQMRLLPYRIAKVGTAAKDKSWTLDRTTAERPPFVRFQERGYAGVDRIEVRTALELDEERTPDLLQESRVHLRYTSGKAALASRRKPGQGEVLVLTTSANDEKWTDLYIAPSFFVPFVQIAVNSLLEGQTGEVNRVAGEPLVWQAPTGDESAYDLVHPNGARPIGFPVLSSGRNLVTATDTQRAGLYRIVPRGRVPGDNDPLYAVGPDLRETDDLTTLKAAEIDKLIGFSAIHLTAGDDGGVFSGAERLKREWTFWLLALLLVLVLCEMALAWYCGRAW